MSPERCVPLRVPCQSGSGKRSIPALGSVLDFGGRFLSAPADMPERGAGVIDGTVLICGGHVIDPANGVDGQFDILIRNGIIDQVGAIEPKDDVPEFDAAG